MGRTLLSVAAAVGVCANLHHPEYRERYAANLRCEIHRIPFVGTTGAKAPEAVAPVAGLKPGSSTDVDSATSADSGADARSTVEERPFQGRVSDRKKENNSALPKAVAGGQSPQATGAATDADVFRAFVKAGQRLAEIHVHYEQQAEYPLTKIEKKGEKLDYRVEKMKPNKDQTQLISNKFLTLDGIPPETLRTSPRQALRSRLDHRPVPAAGEPTVRVSSLPV